MWDNGNSQTLTEARATVLKGLFDVRSLRQVFFRVPFDSYSLQSLRVDLEENAQAQPDCLVAHGYVLVFPGDMVRIRLLSQHGLALAGEDETGALRYASIVPDISHPIVYRA